MALSAGDFNKIADTVLSLVRDSITPADLEKELLCRDKWGKRQNYMLEEFNTEELKLLINNWQKAISSR